VTRTALGRIALRAVLALIPGVAIRRPIKKWGAVGALIAAAAYLALSGAEVATQRAFIMTADGVDHATDSVTSVKQRRGSFNDLDPVDSQRVHRLRVVA